MQAAEPGGRRSEPHIRSGPPPAGSSETGPPPARTPPAGPPSPSGEPVPPGAAPPQPKPAPAQPTSAPSQPTPAPARQDVSLLTIAREWGRIGCIGFGGPPAHIALLRQLCVDRRGWISAQEFEDGIAATNILPGPASTQLAIFCAWRLRGPRGALVGGACFIVPGLIVILALSAVFLAAHPPLWISGAAGGADAAVPVVAVSAAIALVPASWRRVGAARPARARWACYLVVGGVAAALVGPYLVLVLVGCGLVEMLARHALPISGPASRDCCCRRWPLRR